MINNALIHFVVPVRRLADAQMTTLGREALCEAAVKEGRSPIMSCFSAPADEHAQCKAHLPSRVFLI